MRLVLVHGFNVRDGGAGTVDKLAPYFLAAGHEVDTDQADYGWLGLLGVRLMKHRAVKRIAVALEQADAVISHSNGSHYEHKALRALRGRKSVKSIRLSPALNRATAAAPTCRQCFVFFTRSDFWTWLAAFVPLSGWGAQGHYGYKGSDPRMVNWDYSDLVKGHSGWFDEDTVARIAADILEALENES